MDDFSFDPSVLAVFVLGTCLACIYAVFFFGRRLQTSAYLRDSLVEGAKQLELKTLLSELRDRAIKGPLDHNSPPPDRYGPTGRLWQPDIYGTIQPPYPDDYHYGEETEEEKERQERHQEELKLYNAWKKWESEERARYETLRQKAEAEALERAEKKIPRSIDISLLGGGWAFLLEFSTVIVIIFTLLIFGILGTLEGTEISTILAAIAGYVLGKATAGTKPQERPVGEATSTPPTQ